MSKPVLTLDSRLNGKIKAVPPMFKGADCKVTPLAKVGEAYIPLFESDEYKAVVSPDYNLIFNKRSGETARWGKTFEDDPFLSIFGPEIADIEVTTICKGPGGVLCPFCYKANTSNGHNMSLETFTKIIDALPKHITQVAIGADAQAESNPELWDMMDLCRERGIIPNITVADITEETSKTLVSKCGAVAVSRYKNKNFCYDSIEKLVRNGLKYVNMHIMISKETYEQAVETIKDYHSDPRLKGMYSIVLLSLKQKGRGEGFTPLDTDEFKALVELAEEHEVPIGFDSCSAPAYIKAIKHKENFEKLQTYVEPCESTLFSIYFSAEGKFYPCSFCEDVFEGIDINEIANFIDDIWFSDTANKFRKMLKLHEDENGCRNCPVFNVTGKNE